MIRELFSAKNIFSFSVMSLYLLNLLFHIEMPFFDVLIHLLWPAVLVASMRYLRWELKVCFTKQVRRPLLWNSILVLVILIVVLVSNEEYPMISAILPAFGLCMAPYLYGHCAKSAMTAVVASSLIFIIASSFINTGAIVIISLTTLCIIWGFLSLSWWYNDDQNAIKRKSVIASLAFLAVLFLLVSTPLLEDAFKLSAMGRPSLGNSFDWNEEWRIVISNAKWFTAAEMELGQHSWIYAAVLARAGWFVFGIVVLLTVLMLFSGGYLVLKRFHIQKFYIIGAYCLVALQTVGSFLMCFGWNDLLLAEITPLMSDNFLTNALYLLMCAIILPPRPVCSEGDEVYD